MLKLREIFIKILNFRPNLQKIWNILKNKIANTRKCSTKFNWTFEFGAVQKSVNLVELEQFCKMSIWLQKSASIQPRTSLSKFAQNWLKVRLKVRPNIALSLPARRATAAGLGAEWMMNWIWIQIWRGSLSAVSTPIFATKYSFCCIFRDLQD